MVSKSDAALTAAAQHPKRENAFWYTCAAVILVVLALDLALLERKYEIFRGGFLQSHQIAGVGNIALFVGTLLLSEAFFFVGLAGAWLAVARWHRTHTKMAAYHFACVIGGASIALIAVRYQLLSYFSDFFNFTILKNLGGGDAEQAVVYVLEESKFMLAGLAAVIAVYVTGHFLARRRWWRTTHQADAGAITMSSRRSLGLCVACFAGLVLLILAVNRHQHMRYHLNRVTAYSYPRELLDMATDFDGDGYGLFAWTPDPSPFNASIYPNAIDIPDDGIDQDGLMGDFKYRPRPGYRIEFAGTKRHVMVVVLESARAGVLRASVGGKPVAPNLQQLAQAGAASELFFSHTGFTTSSIKAVFGGSLTSKLPLGMGLFPLLKQNGYQIGVISGQNESFGDMAQELKMRESSDVFFDATSAPGERVFPSAAAGSLTLSNERVLKQFAEVAQRFDWNRPVFTYINFQSAHFPYYYPGMPKLLDRVEPLERSAISRDNQARLETTYLNAIANADRAVGTLIGKLKALGQFDNTVFVVCGDHGESLFDDGMLGHGHQLNDVQTRTLFVTNQKAPAFSGLMGQTDLAVQLLRAAGAVVMLVEPPRATNAQAATGAATAASADEVFQIIGTLDAPAAIGFVNAERKRLTFNTTSREVVFDPLNQRLPLDKMDAYPAQAARLKQLIQHWETLRWENQLAKQGLSPFTAGVTPAVAKR